MIAQTRTMLLYVEATPWELDYVPSRLRLIETVVRAEPLTADKLPARADQASVLSVGARSPVDRALLDRLPRLRLLLIRSAAPMDIDLAACRERDVATRVVSGESEYAAAEHTFALLLALARRLVVSGDDLAPEITPGWELRGKTFGIIGLGRVGRRVARLARAFEMPVLACDLRPDVRQAEATGLHLVAPEDLRHWVLPLSPQDLAAEVQVVPLEDLLARSDIVSLHVPLTNQTRALIDAGAIARMKPGSVLLDIAQRALIDLDAVRSALEAGKLGGAGFDVLDQDEMRALFAPTGHGQADRSTATARRPLNIICSSHAAGTSVESIRRSAIVTVELVGRFMEGQPVEADGLTGGR